MAEIGGYPEAKLLNAAKCEVAKKTASSILLNEESEALVPKFSLDELVVGRILGRGGFCEVSDIKKVSTKEPVGPIDADAPKSHDFFQDRAYMSTQYIRGDKKQFRYAIKQIQPGARKNAELFVKSVMDIAVEARYLAVLRHPNIIKMRAVSTTSAWEPGNPFFLIIDKLYAILDTTLKTTWKDRMPGPLSWCCSSAVKKAKEFWTERLTVAYDLSIALDYLHSSNIMYRDIKPHNVGFDIRGALKLFDFGLVREMRPELKRDDGTYLFTGGSGSLRYMAPEMALDQPYNETCDVYSFCILLWQILMVETPFAMYNTEDFFRKRVFEGGIRPEVDKKWPLDLNRIMALGWGSDIHKRPSMEEVSLVLRQVVFEESGVERAAQFDISRSSFRLKNIDSL